MHESSCQRPTSSSLHANTTLLVTTSTYHLSQCPNLHSESQFRFFHSRPLFAQLPHPNASLNPDLLFSVRSHRERDPPGASRDELSFRTLRHNRHSTSASSSLPRVYQKLRPQKRLEPQRSPIRCHTWASSPSSWAFLVPLRGFSSDSKQRFSHFGPWRVVQWRPAHTQPTPIAHSLEPRSLAFQGHTYIDSGAGRDLATPALDRLMHCIREAFPVGLGNRAIFDLRLP